MLLYKRQNGKQSFEHMRMANSIQRRALIWFVFAALLTAIFIATTSPAAAQSSTNAPAISSAQLKKVKLYLAAGNGDKVKIGPIAGEKLGIPSLATTELWQLPATDPETKFGHVFFTLPDGGMLFSFINTTTAYTYHVDANLKLIASVAMSNRMPSDIPNPELGLQAELKCWAGIADQLDDSDLKPKSSSTTNSPTK